MDNIPLKVNIRKATGKKLSTLRKKGFVPGVVYGKGIDNVLVSVELSRFNEVFKQGGESTLIDLEIENEDRPRTVLIYDVASDVLKEKPIHVDFYQVRLDEKIKTEVPLAFTGESKAVKELGGTLIKQLHSVEIESLPGEIPHEIQVDVSRLETFDDHLTIGDLKTGTRAEIVGNPEEVVALVVPPRTEKELEELESPPTEEIEKIEGVEKEEEPEEQKEEKSPQSQEKEKDGPNKD